MCVCVYMCVCVSVSQLSTPRILLAGGVEMCIYICMNVYIYIYVCVRDVHRHHLGRSDTHLNALPTIQYIKAT